MTIIADTNVLLRFILGDDEDQQRSAGHALENNLVAVSVYAVCELAWVMDRTYKVKRTDVATAIRMPMRKTNILMDRPAVEAGLHFLVDGGDFADGIIAYDGSKLGGTVFTSFDRKAVRIAKDRGLEAETLA